MTVNARYTCALVVSQLLLNTIPILLIIGYGNPIVLLSICLKAE